MRGDIYALVKTNARDIGDWKNITALSLDVKYFHPSCLYHVAGKEYLVKEDQ
jgi:hypothetical protein